MCSDRIVCSPHNHPDLRQKGDAQGTCTKLCDDISNSLSPAYPDIVLSPVQAGDPGVVTRCERYSLAREDVSICFVPGKTGNFMGGGRPGPGSWCSRHTDGSGFVIRLNGPDHIVPGEQHEQVAREEVPRYPVRPAGST
jgi:hypothetical protein